MERLESGVGHFTSDSATLFVVCSRCIEYLRLIVVHTNTKTTKVNKMHNVWNFEVGFVQLSYDFKVPNIVHFVYFGCFRVRVDHYQA